MSDIPAEVDFAARYWLGDATEGYVPVVRRAWVVDEGDGVLLAYEHDDESCFVVTFDSDNQASFASVTRMADGTFEISTASESTRFRLDTDGYIFQL